MCEFESEVRELKLGLKRQQEVEEDLRKQILSQLERNRQIRRHLHIARKEIKDIRGAFDALVAAFDTRING